MIDTSCCSHRFGKPLILLTSLLLANCVREGQAENEPPTGVAEVQQPSAERIALEMRQSLARIKSIAYTFHSTNKSPFGPGPGPAIKRPLAAISSSGEFTYDGGKFLSDYSMLRDGKTTIAVRIAFDGDRYQTYLPRENDFRTSVEAPHRNPYGTLPPPLYPFMFV